MAHRSQRLDCVPPWVTWRWWGLAGAVSLALATLAVWTLLQVKAPAKNAQSVGAEASVVVTRRPFTSALTFAGTIVPADGISVVAPFDGTVKRLGFVYGERVTAGQVLAEFDTLDIDRTRNDAESAYLKAREQAGNLEDWAAGPEVMRAQRSVANAEYDLQDTRRRMQESQSLYDRGLIPRSEIDGLSQQLRSREMALTAANEDLAATLRRGRGPNLRVAAIELQNTQSRLQSLNAQRGQAVLRAPNDGIILRPPVKTLEASSEAAYAGMRLGKGQLIGTIVQAGDLAVAFKLDEGDINTLNPGQAVRVTGSGFPGIVMSGTISALAGEAEPSQGTKASFAAMARLAPLTAAQAKAVRIGMSANIMVIVYQTSSAIVVPPQAVNGAGPSAFVHVRGGKPGLWRKTPIRIGHVAPGGVEVVSGLKPGDVVVWRQPAMPAGRFTGASGAHVSTSPKTMGALPSG